MKEFIDKLIERLEEEKAMHTKFYRLSEYRELPEIKARHELIMHNLNKTIEIVNELAEEYKVSEMLTGWIPCSERLPQENEPVDTVCEVVNVMLKSGTVTSGWCNRYLERWYVLDEYCDYPLQQNYEDVIAWQPLPAPYQPKGE